MRECSMRLVGLSFNAKCEILIKQKNNLFSQKGNYSRLLLPADGRVKRATTLLLLMAITFYFTLQINNMNYFVCVFYSFHSDDTANVVWLQQIETHKATASLSLKRRADRAGLLLRMKTKCTHLD